MADTSRPHPRPPRLARMLLRLRTPRRLHEWMAGDLQEAFLGRCDRDGHRAARRWYWRQVRASAAPPPRAGEPRLGAERRAAVAWRLTSDLREAAANLLRSPGFTMTAVLLLALGIGVNTTIFSWLDAVLLTPIPGARHGAQLVQLATTFNGFYENCPVIQSEGDTRASRLALCEAAARTMDKGLELLGIEVVEKM